MKYSSFIFLLLAVLVTTPAITLAQGAGSALQFDGVDDYVTAGTPDVIATGGGNNGMTISAWIKVASFESDMARIITKTVGVAEQDHYWMLSFMPSNGIKLRFRLKTDIGGTKTLIASSGNLEVNVWTHVAAVYDGSHMILYKDGIEVGRTTKTGVIATNNGIAAMIGNNAPAASSRPFHGLIEDVRLLNRGLSIQELREEIHRTRTGLEPEMVGYWMMNEGSGPLAGDATGNFHTGVLRNGTSWSLSTAPLGVGVSNTQTVATTGGVNFAGTDLSINFGIKSGTDQIVVTRLDNRPEGTQPASVNAVLPKYWIMNRYGNGTFVSEMTFTTGPNTISHDDQITPSNLKLFNRPANSDGPWTEIASAMFATSSSVTFSGISATGQFAIGTIGDSPLPIQLASFTAAVVSGMNVRLDWTTLTEVNNYGFFVQRRTLNDELFSDLPNSFVSGNGTTIQPHDYSWTDTQVSPGQYQYRLRQVDLDGTDHFTDAVAVVVEILASAGTLEAPEEFRLAQNYPNPFNPSTRIQFTVEKNGMASVQVFNILGQEVATLFSGYAESGRVYSLDFDASALTNGAYMYRLTSNGQTSIRKMTLLK